MRPIATFVFTLFAALITTAVEANHSSSKCAEELQGALFEPETYANQYMRSVAKEFKTGANLLFGPEADAYISRFENQWGVNVAVAEPFNICGSSGKVTVKSALADLSCTTVTNSSLEVGGFGSYTFAINYDVVPSYVSILIDGTTTSSAASLGSFVLRHNSNEPVSLYDGLLCNTETNTNSAFSVGFAEDGLNQNEMTCGDEQNAGTTIKPSESFAENFYSESVQGTWTLAVNSDSVGVSQISFTFCYASPDPVASSTGCSRDIMKALTNFPGFRFDADAKMVYYTENVYDASGRTKQVTISRSIDGIYMKK